MKRATLFLMLCSCALTGCSQSDREDLDFEGDPVYQQLPKTIVPVGTLVGKPRNCPSASGQPKIYVHPIFKNPDVARERNISAEAWAADADANHWVVYARIKADRDDAALAKSILQGLSVATTCISVGPFGRPSP